MDYFCVDIFHFTIFCIFAFEDMRWRCVRELMPGSCQPWVSVRRKLTCDYYACKLTFIYDRHIETRIAQAIPNCNNGFCGLLSWSWCRWEVALTLIATFVSDIHVFKLLQTLLTGLPMMMDDDDRRLIFSGSDFFGKEQITSGLVYVKAETI